MSVLVLSNTDVVAVAFLKAILDRPSGVGTELPGNDSWTADGFVQVTSGIGGSSSPNVPRRSPVVSVKCWARPAGNSRRPPWAQANNLAEQIRVGCFRAYQEPPILRLPDGYPVTHVLSAYLLTEPRRIPGDDSAFACYQFDLLVHWISRDPA